MTDTSSVRSGRPLDGFLRLNEVRAVTGLGRSTIYRRIAHEDFPAAYELIGGRVGWRRSDIEAWLDSRTKRDPRS